MASPVPVRTDPVGVERPPEEPPYKVMPQDAAGVC